MHRSLDQQSIDKETVDNLPFAAREFKWKEEVKLNWVTFFSISLEINYIYALSTPPS